MDQSDFWSYWQGVGAMALVPRLFIPDNSEVTGVIRKGQRSNSAEHARIAVHAFPNFFTITILSLMFKQSNLIKFLIINNILKKSLVRLIFFAGRF
jgi:hypothetical protein